MANLAVARGALKKVEGILRRRYHYPHPIFEHLAEAQKNIAEDAPKPKVEAPPKPEAEAPPEPEAEAPPEPEADVEKSSPGNRRSRKER